MNLLKKIPFPFENQQFEIRILYEKNLINIVPFLHNHPANGFRYQIQIPQNTPVQKLYDERLYTHLIQICQEDITQNRWNSFTRALI